MLGLLATRPPSAQLSSQIKVMTTTTTVVSRPVTSSSVTTRTFIEVKI